LSAAYAMLGVVCENGRARVGDDLFAPIGELQVESLRIDATTWTRKGPTS
jgi:hypothetical protein